MQRDDYWSGKHFWTHFCCGLVVGGGLGTWISWGMFVSRLACFGLAVGITVLFAYCAGKWGDAIWHWILSHWS
jgi:hypothetical protein